MPLDSQTRKQLKAIGHALNPVVTVASKGLSDSVLEEIRRALHDHELIKVKVAVGDREAKQAVIAEMCQRCECELAQTIGHIALIYKANPNAKLGVSNLRHLQ